MKEKYTPGQDCKCHAYSESECGCDADWTLSEVYELRWKLERERAIADRLAEGLRKMVLYSEALILRIQDRSDINFKTLNECIDLFNEWKEARND